MKFNILLWYVQQYFFCSYVN